MAQIRTLADVEAMEATPLANRNLPNNIHEFFMRSAQNYGDKDALRFFLQATAYQQTVRYSYRDLLAKIRQTANMLNGLGVGPKDTVSYVLPNTPQTYFSLYGAEIAGIAKPINPLLEAHVIAEIMNAAKSKVLVTLGYSGWAAGQLEEEIGRNGWLTVDASPSIIFDTPVELRYERALALLGVDPRMLSSDAGHA